MDVVGSEIGQKMRSAIKAKLTELGCYVDDELPDYVMVMVANKRTRTQMEDDLQLFLGDNTTLFVNWLHQVLKKLQEVTVTTPLKNVEHEVSIERSSSKEKKSKDKIEKEKTKKAERLKKAKKKEKAHRKKEEKKIHKSKKKSKHHGMIRPNVPPLLMNIEKVSEPSITDVFAGQILKSHGMTLDSLHDEPTSVIPDIKPIVKETKRPILPIIDPATISSQPDPDTVSLNTELVSISRENTPSVSSIEAPKEEQLKEINEIEAKILGLKQKLAEQLDSMSEDEDFLNIRTEAEELMNDFAEDVFQEISQQAPVETSPLKINKSPSPPPIDPAPKPIEIAKTIETLPQIELKLPKRPIRERLGVREEPKKVEVKEKEPEKRKSPDRFTPEREPDRPLNSKSVKSRLSDHPEKQRHSSEESSEKSESSTKRLTSRVSVLGNRNTRVSCASVVRVRPRPRVGAPASSLLLRAVADAHKSLLSIPPKIDQEPPMVKRALVLPMRRVGEPKIMIQVPGSDHAHSDNQSDNISLGDIDSEDEKASKKSPDIEKQEYVPKSITMKIKNTNYVPSTRNEGRTASRRDDSLIIETINIHNPTVDKDKNTQFIVTMDGFNPNAFLANKLRTEGLLNDGDEVEDKSKESNSVFKKTRDTKAKEGTKTKDGTKTRDCTKSKDDTRTKDKVEEKTVERTSFDKKRLSNESEESETQVIIKQEKEDETSDVVVERTAEKRKSDVDAPRSVDSAEVPAVKKRKASPIVFDVRKKEKEVVKERERTESVSSDSHVIVTTATNPHKYDSVPPLSASERKSVWCRSFPLCRYGASCAFQHPKCKFAASCTRRGCVYAHAPGTPTHVTPPTTPTVSSHVVPAANYKSISAVPMPSMCKFYPNCVNPGCPFYHPKPCRYGPACLNKVECNFYHADSSATKWRYPV